MKKRTSLAALDLKLNDKTTTDFKPHTRVQRAIYFDHNVEAAISEYVLTEKNKGNRQANFTRCVNEALELYIAEKGIIVKK